MQTVSLPPVDSQRNQCELKTNQLQARNFQPILRFWPSSLNLLTLPPTHSSIPVTFYQTGQWPPVDRIHLNGSSPRQEAWPAHCRTKQMSDGSSTSGICQDGSGVSGCQGRGPGNAIRHQGQFPPQKEQQSNRGPRRQKTGRGGEPAVTTWIAPLSGQLCELCCGAPSPRSSLPSE